MNLYRALRAMALASLALPACGRAQPPAAAGSVSPTAARSSQGSSPSLLAWNQMVDAAKREGMVNLYAGVSTGLRDVVVAPFETAFPGIKVNGTFGSSSSMVPRLLAERQSGKYLADVIIGGGSDQVITLKPAGALAPLETALVRRDVADPSLWRDNRLWWTDSAKPFTTLRFQGYVDSPVSYNTKLVQHEQFGSYWDLVDPKWKGKIVSFDVRRPGPGAIQLKFLYRQAELGPKFLDVLFGDMSIMLSEDARQMTDWLAQGRYPIGLWVESAGIKVAAEQGLPVARFAADQLKEGVALTEGGGALSLVDSAPHPNAAKVFANWLLTREAQMVWQEHVLRPSLRADVPKDSVDPDYLPRPSVQYVDGNEEFHRTSADEIQAVVQKALERGTRS